MRNKFIDLINNNCTPNPASAFKDMSPQDMVDQRMDPIIQQYNSHWGAISNTSLLKNPEGEGYIINGGSLFTDDDWTEFCCSTCWGGYEFRFINRCGVNEPHSLAEWAMNMGMELSICSELCCKDVRGYLIPYTPEKLAEITAQTYTTSESKLPRPFFEIETVKGAVERALQQKEVGKIIEALNSHEVLAKDWMYVNERFVGKLANKIIII